MKRVITIIVVVAVVAVAGFFGYQYLQKSKSTATSIYQTVKVTKGDLTATVGGTGTVRANQSGTVSWQTSGRIASIDAKVGDSVTASQTLAKLDPKSLGQSIILARADLVTAQRNLENLKDSGTATAQAFQVMSVAQKEVDDAKTARESKQYARAQNDTIEVAQANLDLAQSEYDTAANRYDNLASRPKDDILRAQALSNMNAARQKRDRNQANLDYLKGGPDQNEIDQADARVKVAEAKLADAQREWDRLKNGADARDLAAAQARIDAIQSILDEVDIEAPFAGVITESHSKVGDQVNTGTISYRLDDLSRLLIDVQITEVDINRIKLDQPATLTFDAIQSKEYTGKVVEVGRVGSNVSGVVNFVVTVELANNDGQVRPGMTSAVTLVTEKLTKVLLVPNRAVRLRDGSRIVYTLVNGIPTPTNIKLGLTSDTNSQILEGVKEGEELVLNPPVQLQGGQPGSTGN
jgi:HlyD family secretion protein